MSIQPLTSDYFAALIDRILPPDYIAALKEPGPGYERYQSLIAMGVRLSLAAYRYDTDLHLLSSAGATNATATVQFYRASTAAGAVTVKAGTVVGTGVGRRLFILKEDAVFGALDLGPIDAVVVSTHAGYEYNVTGERTTAGGVLLPGAIDTIFFPVQEPPFGDPSIMVSQKDDATGGHPPVLDQLGADRGLPRRPNESDVIYRARVRRLPDTVSPGAVRRTIEDIVAPYNLTYEFIETFQRNYQTAFDVGFGDVAFGVDPNLFAYDDPRPPPAYANPQFRNRWLGEDYRGSFIVVVPNLGAVSDVGMGFDDTAMNPAAHVTPGFPNGRRAHAAFDVPRNVDPTLVLEGGYDGFDLKKQAVYKGLQDALDEIKAGGVIAAVELAGE